MATPLAQIARMTVTRRRLAESASNSQQQVKYRISKPHGWLMTTVAVIFDLLPLIMIILLAVFIYFKISSAADFIPLQEHDAAVKEIRGDLPWYFKSFGFAYSLYGGAYGRDIGRAGVKVGAGVVAAGSVPVMGPIIYMVGSLVATTLSFIVFLVWFGLKGVFIFSLNPKRVGANLIALVTESLPLVNMLPGITMAVVMHIRATRTEDKERHKRKYGVSTAM